MRLRRKVSQEEDVNRERDVIDDIVDVIVESVEESKDMVAEVFEEINEVVDEHIEETFDTIKEVIEEREEGGEKRSYAVGRRKVAEEDDEVMSEFRKMLRTLLRMPENPELCRELGRKMLDDIKWKYGVSDEFYYTVSRWIDYIAEAQEERIRLRPEIEEIVRKKYPWLFDDE